MIEIEMKFPVADFAAVEGRLAEWRARPGEPLPEADHYFNAPDRDFGQTDEAFRLRRVGPANRVTYKGPKHPGPTKTRTEIEVGLDPGDEAAAKWCRMMQALGYRPTAVVRKRRVPYSFPRGGYALEVCCDEVDDVGRFVEVEIVAPPDEKAQAQAVVQAVARELGLERAESRSYLHMVLEKQGGARK